MIRAFETSQLTLFYFKNLCWKTAFEVFNFLFTSELMTLTTKKQN